MATRKYTVNLHTMASAAITVEVDEDKVREQLGDDANEPDILAEYLREEAIEQAFDHKPPHPCAQCSGSRKSFSLDLGDDWDLDDDEGAVQEVES